MCFTGGRGRKAELEGRNVESLKLLSSRNSLDEGDHEILESDDGKGLVWDSKVYQKKG